MEHRSEYTNEITGWRVDEVGRYWGWIPHPDADGYDKAGWMVYKMYNPVSEPEKFAGHLKIHAFGGEVIKASFDQRQSRHI